MTQDPTMPPATPMTQEIINRLKELLAKASPRPWTVYSEPEVGLPPSLFSGTPMESGFGPLEPLRGYDLELVVETINALPALLSILTNLTPSGVERIRAEALKPGPCVWCKAPGQLHTSNDREISWVACPNGQCMAHGPREWSPEEAVAVWNGLVALPSGPPSQDWRCVSCKRVVQSATEPEQCNCLGRTFAKIDTPSQGDVEGLTGPEINRLQCAAAFLRSGCGPMPGYADDVEAAIRNLASKESASTPKGERS